MHVRVGQMDAPIANWTGVERSVESGAGILQRTGAAGRDGERRQVEAGG